MSENTLFSNAPLRAFDEEYLSDDFDGIAQAGGEEIDGEEVDSDFTPAPPPPPDTVSIYLPHSRYEYETQAMKAVRGAWTQVGSTYTFSYQQEGTTQAGTTTVVLGTPARLDIPLATFSDFQKGIFDGAYLMVVPNEPATRNALELRDVQAGTLQFRVEKGTTDRPGDRYWYIDVETDQISVEDPNASNSTSVSSAHHDRIDLYRRPSSYQTTDSPFAQAYAVNMGAYYTERDRLNALPPSAPATLNFRNFLAYPKRYSISTEPADLEKAFIGILSKGLLFGALHKDVGNLTATFANVETAIRILDRICYQGDYTPDGFYSATYDSMVYVSTGYNTGTNTDDNMMSAQTGWGVTDAVRVNPVVNGPANVQGGFQNDFLYLPILKHSETGAIVVMANGEYFGTEGQTRIRTDEEKSYLIPEGYERATDAEIAAYRQELTNAPDVITVMSFGANGTSYPDDTKPPITVINHDQMFFRDRYGMHYAEIADFFQPIPDSEKYEYSDMEQKLSFDQARVIALHTRHIEQTYGYEFAIKRNGDADFEPGPNGAEVTEYAAKYDKKFFVDAQNAFTVALAQAIEADPPVTRVRLDSWPEGISFSFDEVTEIIDALEDAKNGIFEGLAAFATSGKVDWNQIALNMVMMGGMQLTVAVATAPIMGFCFVAAGLIVNRYGEPLMNRAEGVVNRWRGVLPKGLTIMPESEISGEDMRDYIGQLRVRRGVLSYLEAKAQGRVCDPIIIIGPPGVGKTTLVQNVIANIYKNRPEIYNQFNRLITGRPDQLNAALGIVGADARVATPFWTEGLAHGSLLVVDEAHQLVGIGIAQGHDSSAVTEFAKPLIASGVDSQGRPLGAGIFISTEDEWARARKRNPAYCRRFRVVRMDNIGTPERRAIVADIAKRGRATTGRLYTDGAIDYYMNNFIAIDASQHPNSGCVANFEALDSTIHTLSQLSPEEGGITLERNAEGHLVVTEAHVITAINSYRVTKQQSTFEARLHAFRGALDAVCTRHGRTTAEFGFATAEEYALLGRRSHETSWADALFRINRLMFLFGTTEANPLSEVDRQLGAATTIEQANDIVQQTRLSVEALLNGSAPPPGAASAGRPGAPPTTPPGTAPPPPVDAQGIPTDPAERQAFFEQQRMNRAILLHFSELGLSAEAAAQMAHIEMTAAIHQNRLALAMAQGLNTTAQALLDPSLEPARRDALRAHFALTIGSQYDSLIGLDPSAGSSFRGFLGEFRDRVSRGTGETSSFLGLTHYLLRLGLHIGTSGVRAAASSRGPRTPEIDAECARARQFADDMVTEALRRGEPVPTTTAIERAYTRDVRRPNSIVLADLHEHLRKTHPDYEVARQRKARFGLTDYRYEPVAMAEREVAYATAWRRYNLGSLGEGVTELVFSINEAVEWLDLDARKFFTHDDGRLLTPEEAEAKLNYCRERLLGANEIGIGANDWVEGQLDRSEALAREYERLARVEGYRGPLRLSERPPVDFMDALRKQFRGPHAAAHFALALWIGFETLLTHMQGLPNLSLIDSVKEFLVGLGKAGLHVTGFMAVHRALDAVIVKGVPVVVQDAIIYFRPQSTYAVTTFMSKSMAGKLLVGAAGTATMAAAGAFLDWYAFTTDDELQSELAFYARSGNPSLEAIEQHAIETMWKRTYAVHLPGAAGFMVGGALGAAIGSSFSPGIGTAIGTLVGLMVGGAAYLAAEIRYQYFDEFSKEEQLLMAVDDELARIHSSGEYDIDQPVNFTFNEGETGWLDILKTQSTDWRQYSQAMAALVEPLESPAFRFDEFIANIDDPYLTEQLETIKPMTLIEALSHFEVTNINLDLEDFNLNTLFGVLIEAAKEEGPKEITLRNTDRILPSVVGSIVCFEAVIEVFSGAHAGTFKRALGSLVPQTIAGRRLKDEREERAEAARYGTEYDYRYHDASVASLDDFFASEAEAGRPITADYDGVSRMLFTQGTWGAGVPRSLLNEMLFALDEAVFSQIDGSSELPWWVTDEYRDTYFEHIRGWISSDGAARRDRQYSLTVDMDPFPFLRNTAREWGVYPEVHDAIPDWSIRDLPLGAQLLLPPSGAHINFGDGHDRKILIESLVQIIDDYRWSHIYFEDLPDTYLENNYEAAVYDVTHDPENPNYLEFINPRMVLYMDIPHPDDIRDEETGELRIPDTPFIRMLFEDYAKRNRPESLNPTLSARTIRDLTNSKEITRAHSDTNEEWTSVTDSEQAISGFEEAWTEGRPALQANFAALVDDIFSEDNYNNTYDRARLLLTTRDFITRNRPALGRLVTQYGLDWEYISSLSMDEINGQPIQTEGGWAHPTWDYRVVAFMEAFKDDYAIMSDVASEFAKASKKHDLVYAAQCLQNLRDFGYNHYAMQLRHQLQGQIDDYMRFVGADTTVPRLEGEEDFDYVVRHFDTWADALAAWGKYSEWCTSSSDSEIQGSMHDTIVNCDMEYQYGDNNAARLVTAARERLSTMSFDDMQRIASSDHIARVPMIGNAIQHLAQEYIWGNWEYYTTYYRDSWTNERSYRQGAGALEAVERLSHRRTGRGDFDIDWLHEPEDDFEKLHEYLSKANLPSGASDPSIGLVSDLERVLAKLYEESPQLEAFATRSIYGNTPPEERRDSTIRLSTHRMLIKMQVEAVLEYLEPVNLVLQQRKTEEEINRLVAEEQQEWLLVIEDLDSDFLTQAREEYFNDDDVVNAFVSQYAPQVALVAASRGVDVLDGLAMAEIFVETVTNEDLYGYNLSPIVSDFMTTIAAMYMVEGNENYLLTTIEDQMRDQTPFMTDVVYDAYREYTGHEPIV